MGLARTRSHPAPGRAGAAEGEQARRAVIWHDLECGRYTADLPLWRELARVLPAGAHILEVGAGTGRVALDLARRGHPVTALERDPALLAALDQRGGGLPLATVLADARTFELDRRDFALCLVPMQSLQLFGGRPGRRGFFERARAHLRPGGLLACAVIETLEPFDCAAEGVRPTTEIARIGEELYCSEAVRVRSGRRGIQIERERIIARPDAPAERSRERALIELDPVTAEGLEQEGRAAGLRPAVRLEVPATEEHAGSMVVSFGA